MSEAHDSEGKRVRYQPPGGKPEYGTLTGFSAISLVYVMFDGDTWSKAMPPEHLELVGEDAEEILAAAQGRVDALNRLIADLTSERDAFMDEFGRCGRWLDGHSDRKCLRLTGHGGDCG